MGRSKKQLKDDKLSKDVIVHVVKGDKKVVPQPFLWTMKNGLGIRICDMTDSHLCNTVAMIRRRVKENNDGDDQFRIVGYYRDHFSDKNVLFESMLRLLQTGSGYSMSQLVLRDTIDLLACHKSVAFPHLLLECQRRGLEIQV